MAGHGEHGFRVELDSLHWQLLVPKTHHQSVIGFGRDLQRVRNGGSFNDQRVVARGFQGIGKT